MLTKPIITHITKLLQRKYRDLGKSDRYDELICLQEYMQSKDFKVPKTANHKNKYLRMLLQLRIQFPDVPVPVCLLVQRALDTDDKRLILEEINPCSKHLGKLRAEVLEEHGVYMDLSRELHGSLRCVCLTSLAKGSRKLEGRVKSLSSAIARVQPQIQSAAKHILADNITSSNPRERAALAGIVATSQNLDALNMLSGALCPTPEQIEDSNRLLQAPDVS